MSSFDRDASAEHNHMPSLSTPYLCNRYQPKQRMSYLLKKYGMKSEVKVKELTLEEKEIEEQLSSMMEIVDQHTEFWQHTKSILTKESLAITKNLLASLITALHMSGKERIVKACVALLNSDMETVIKCFRLPKMGPEDQEYTTIKSKVSQDRNVFKMKIIQVIDGFKKFVTESDERILEAVAQNGEKSLEEFLNGKRVKAEAIDVQADMDEDFNLQ